MRTLYTTFLVIALGLSSPSMAGASEQVDFRINLLLMPPTEEVTVHYSDVLGNSYSSSTDRLNNGWRVEAGIAGRPHRFSNRYALLASTMLFYGNQSASTYKPGERELTTMTGPMEMTTLGLNLRLALEIKLHNNVSLEFGPFVGIGGSTISDTGVGVDGPN